MTGLGSPGHPGNIRILTSVIFMTSTKSLLPCSAMLLPVVGVGVWAFCGEVSIIGLPHGMKEKFKFSSVWPVVATDSVFSY